MRDSAREANKIAGRCIQCLPTDLNHQCPLLKVERLLLAVVNVRWVAPPGGTNTSAMKKAPPFCGSAGGERKTGNRAPGLRARTSSCRWARPYHRKLPLSRRVGNRSRARSLCLPNRVENAATRRGAVRNVSSVPAIRNRASIGAFLRAAETARVRYAHFNRKGWGATHFAAERISPLVRGETVHTQCHIMRPALAIEGACGNSPVVRFK
jgi:hypothetical protein